MSVDTPGVEESLPVGVHMATEIASQAVIWSQVLAEPSSTLDLLPSKDENVAVVGCGTSYYMAEVYARHREALGRGTTRAIVASELDRLHPGEVLLLISRSGTTRDVLRVAKRFHDTTRITGIIGTPASPLVDACDQSVLLAYADEISTVQTRFATSVLTLLRRSLGHDLSQLPAAAAKALEAPLELKDYDHFVFLGGGVAVGLAAEAALKCLEAAGVWAESYPVNEYLHGPVAAANSRSLVWSLSPVPEDVANVVKQTGATLKRPTFEAQVELIMCQRLALELSRLAGKDPDRPRHLHRSVT
jgi:fructoselysine-6-P-deglycase FrlB-like protein